MSKSEDRQNMIIEMEREVGKLKDLAQQEYMNGNKTRYDLIIAIANNIERSLMKLISIAREDECNEKTTNDG